MSMKKTVIQKSRRCHTNWIKSSTKCCDTCHRKLWPKLTAAVGGLEVRLTVLEVAGLTVKLTTCASVAGALPVRRKWRGLLASRAPDPRCRGAGGV